VFIVASTSSSITGLPDNRQAAASPGRTSESRPTDDRRHDGVHVGISQVDFRQPTAPSRSAACPSPDEQWRQTDRRSRRAEIRPQLTGSTDAQRCGERRRVAGIGDSDFAPHFRTGHHFRHGTKPEQFVMRAIWLSAKAIPSQQVEVARGDEPRRPLSIMR
jgi:hypothetical protein